MSLRWLIRRDMKQVLRIEDTNKYSWTEEDFINCLRQRNRIGMVYEDYNPIIQDNVIIGYVVYELHKRKLNILNLTVDPSYRHSGIGKNMMSKLIEKLTTQRRSFIDTMVRESNLTAQLFLREMEFRAISIIKNEYNNEDGYIMRYSLFDNVDFSNNRISEYMEQI